MKRLLLLTVSLVFFVGCPYYNTFYNAKQSFKKAEALRKETLARGSTANDQADRLYDEAIENAARVLRDYPTSDLVDDALLLIGDAFYGKRDYVRAARKYEEILENYPDSRFVPYCAFAAGRASLAAGDSAQAETALLDFIEQYPKAEWVPEGRLALGTLYLAEQKYEQAIDQYTRLLAAFPHDRRRHEARLHIAEATLALKQYDQAFTLFTQAAASIKDRRLTFRAHFMAGECLRAQGRFDQALQAFRQLLKRSQYQEYTPKLLLAIAACQTALGHADTAIVHYQTITAKFAPARQNEAEVAQALYEMGQIYERQGDLDKAEQMYSEAKTRNPKGFWVGEQAATKSTDIHQLKRYQTDLESALNTLQGASREDTTRSTQATPGDSTRHAGTSSDSTKAPGRKQRDKVIKARFQLAETFLFRFNLADSALAQYRHAEQDAPDRETAARAAYAAAWVMEQTVKDTTASRAAYRTIMAQYADTPYGLIAARALALTPADSAGPSDAELFRNAERWLFTENNPDSALVYYRQVVERFSAGAYAARALYAVGWIAETLQASPDSALAIYRHLTKAYPKTEQTRMAQLKLKAIEELTVRTNAARDSASGRAVSHDTTKSVAADSTRHTDPPKEPKRPDEAVQSQQAASQPTPQTPGPAVSPAVSDSAATIRQSGNQQKKEKGKPDH